MQKKIGHYSPPVPEDLMRQLADMKINNSRQFEGTARNLKH